MIHQTYTCDKCGGPVEGTKFDAAFYHSFQNGVECCVKFSRRVGVVVMDSHLCKNCTEAMITEMARAIVGMAFDPT